MRILLALGLVALLPGTAAAQTAPAIQRPAIRAAAPIKPICQDTRPRQAQSPAPARIHPMTQEPNANEYLAVLRTERGCSKPVIVREDIGVRRR